MRELGMVLVGIFAFGIFFSTMIYPNLEYTGYQSAHTCTGECYEEYVRVHGTTVEQLQAKQLAAAGDPFSSIKPLWAGCAACHGQEGQGIATFPNEPVPPVITIILFLNIFKFFNLIFNI